MKEKHVTTYVVCHSEELLELRIVYGMKRSGLGSSMFREKLQGSQQHLGANLKNNIEHFEDKLESESHY
eukprot:4874084-Amphidinium_carterae.1